MVSSEVWGGLEDKRESEWEESSINGVPCKEGTTCNLYEEVLIVAKSLSPFIVVDMELFEREDTRMS